MSQNKQLDPGYVHNGRYRNRFPREKGCKWTRAGEMSKVQWCLHGVDRDIYVSVHLCVCLLWLPWWGEFYSLYLDLILCNNGYY